MKKIRGRLRRRLRSRKKAVGTSAIPRLVLYRSNRNLFTQLVDDIRQKTIMSISTNTPSVREKVGYGGNVKAASWLGEFLARKAQDMGIKRVLFDRSGYKYHGRIRALAEAARKSGLSFGEKGETGIAEKAEERQKKPK